MKSANNTRQGWAQIRSKDIEDMLYQISTHTDQFEARRFDKLSFQRKQKVTFILKLRARRAGVYAEKPFDKDVVREVIDDAKANRYVDLNEGLL